MTAVSTGGKPPRLLHFRVSHYNEKVRWALDHKRVAHLRVACVPGFHVPQVRWLTGQQRLPVLQIGGRVLAGSNHILAEIERLHPEPPLYPQDPAARRRALAIEAYFDEQVAPEVRRLFWACYINQPADCARMACDGFGAATRIAWRAAFPLMRPLFRGNMGLDAASLKAAHARLRSHFDRLESEIGKSGYLVGERFGVADLAAAAVMTAIIRPPQFPYPLPEPWPPELAELRASVSGHPAFRWVLDIYSRHRDPSCEIAALTVS
jgi:glutathione S-transferase